MKIDLYIDEEALSRLEDALPAQAGAQRVAALVVLAWHLRQRDSRRAVLLAERAEALLPAAGVQTPQASLLQARIALTRAEVGALMGDFEPAELSLAQARHFAEPLQDLMLDGDCWLVEAVVALTRGQIERESQAYMQARQCYARTGDIVRQQIAAVWVVFDQVYSDAVAAARNIAALYQRMPMPRHASVTALLAAAEATSLLGREPAQAAVCLSQATELALQSGLVRVAILCSDNGGGALLELSDFDGAALCFEWAATRAREAGWKTLVALSLQRLGELFRDLGQLERSHACLQEALAAMGEAGGSNRAGTYAVLADTLLKLGRTAEAIAAAESAARLFREARAWYNLVFALIGLARAQSADYPVLALETAREAEELIAEFGFTTLRVNLMEALAALYGRHALPPPDDMPTPDAVTYYLEEALRIGNGIVGWQAQAQLYVALGKAWAAAGDMGRAYAYAGEAILAEKREGNRQAANRTALLQVRHDTAQAHAEAEYHRQLAETLSETSRTLALLGQVGQNITASLDRDNIFNSLLKNLGELVDAPHFAIWLSDAGGGSASLRFGVEDDSPLPKRVVALDSPVSLIARCVRERRECLFEPLSGELGPSHIPGTQEMCSALFGPLMIGARVLGVLSIQSRQPHAYGERERLIFRTLCAYGAIALDNAHAYRQLQKAQLQLEDASLTDPLTGLRNRRFLLQHLDREVALTIRLHENAAAAAVDTIKDRDLILFIVDIDHFKDVNDVYGHAAGDAVLVQMVACLRGVFRDTDFLVRWGGEEFLIVARATDRDKASDLAERLRAAVANWPFVLDSVHTIHKTCSIGFTSLPFLQGATRALTWQEAVSLADMALYAMKHAGRDGWMGLAEGKGANAEGLFSRARNALKASVLADELIFFSNKPADAVLAVL